MTCAALAASSARSRCHGQSALERQVRLQGASDLRRSWSAFLRFAGPPAKPPESYSQSIHRRYRKSSRRPCGRNVDNWGRTVSRSRKGGRIRAESAAYRVRRMARRRLEPRHRVIASIATEAKVLAQPAMGAFGGYRRDPHCGSEESYPLGVPKQLITSLDANAGLSLPNHAADLCVPSSI